jgi:putative endonuclease
MSWSVYIILCSDNTFYTGITIDVFRRFEQHAAGQGAKYFRSRQPKQLVYLEPGHNRSSATKREIDLKNLSREEKSQMISSARAIVKSGVQRFKRRPVFDPQFV